MFLILMSYTKLFDQDGFVQPVTTEFQMYIEEPKIYPEKIELPESLKDIYDNDAINKKFQLKYIN